MLRILTKVVLLAAVVLLVVAVGLPLVESTGALDVAEPALASGEALSVAGEGSASLMAVAGDIDAVDLGTRG